MVRTYVRTYLIFYCYRPVNIIIIIVDPRMKKIYTRCNQHYHYDCWPSNEEDIYEVQPKSSETGRPKNMYALIQTFIVTFKDIATIGHRMNTIWIVAFEISHYFTVFLNIFFASISACRRMLYIMQKASYQLPLICIWLNKPPSLLRIVQGSKKPTEHDSYFLQVKKLLTFLFAAVSAEIRWRFPENFLI